MRTAANEIKGPEPETLRPKPQQGEILESSGDLEIGCAGCHTSIGSQETVAVWNRGGFIVVAHIDCASPKVRLRAPFIPGGGL